MGKEFLSYHLPQPSIILSFFPPPGQSSVVTITFVHREANTVHDERQVSRNPRT